MNITDIVKKAQRLATDNSPLLLTAVGVAGTITTAYLTGSASIRAYQHIEHREPIEDRKERYKQRVKLVWKLYIPPVVAGSLTIAAIVGANRVGTRRAAAMAAAYSISERAYDEYKSKVVEKLGANKEQAIRDEIAQDRIERTKENREVVIATNGGDVLCYEAWSGRYFNSDMETLRKAQNDINAQVIHADFATVDEFYEKIGLEGTDASPQFGWNTNKMLELDFSTTLVDEKTPCLVVSFASMPISEPWRFC